MDGWIADLDWFILPGNAQRCMPYRDMRVYEKRNEFNATYKVIH